MGQIVPAVGWKDFQLESKPLIQSAISTTVEFGDQSPRAYLPASLNSLSVRFLIVNS